LSKKKKQRNNMNNILNEIGIENYIFLSTILFFVLGSLAYYTGEMQLSYLCLKLCWTQSIFCLLHFLLITKMHKDKFLSFLYGCSCCRSCRRLAILVSIFRNLGSIDINNLKNLKDKL
jgi:NADH-quinone oxidoreductase subunit K